MTLPTCVACGMAVDWLRSCYSSKFYYSSQPSLSLVGKYSFCDPSTEMLPSPNPYSASIWLKEYEVGDGLGDSLENFEWLDGVPLPTGIKDTLKEVAPIRRGCGSPYDESYGMAGSVLDGLPLVCWRSPAPRIGPYTYRIEVEDLVYDIGAGPVHFSTDLLLSWGDGFGVLWARDDAGEAATMFALDAYPIGNRWQIELYLGSFPSSPKAVWLSYEGTYREGFIVSTMPDTTTPGLTVLSIGSIRVTFVSAPDDSYANPLDIFT